MQKGIGAKVAIYRTLCTSGRSVLFSAITLILCLAGMLQFSEFFLTTMSSAIILAAGAACIGAWTLVPAVVCPLIWKSIVLFP